MTGTTLLTTLVGMLLDGVNHVAIVTNDTERLVKFYQEVFEATVSAEMPAGEGRRLTFIDISPSADLNVFEVQDNTEAQRQTPMFGRGRIDHLGLQAASLDAFNTIRDRLIERGATDGFVTDFGRILSLFFRDPDGLEGEVCVPNPNAMPGVFNPPGTPAVGYSVVDPPRGLAVSQSRGCPVPGHPRRRPGGVDHPEVDLAGQASIEPISPDTSTTKVEARRPPARPSAGGGCR